MPALAANGGFVACLVYRLLILHDRSHGFERDIEIYILAVRDTALYTARQIGACTYAASIGIKSIVVL